MAVVVLAEDSGWHEGERAMHKLMGNADFDNPTTPYLTPGAAAATMNYPLIALGTRDKQGHPWTTLWSGPPGFARPIEQSIIGIRSLVDGTYDPVAEVLLGIEEHGKVVKEDGPGRLVSALTIDLERRKRVKLMGRMIAGVLEDTQSENTEEAKLAPRGTDPTPKSAQAQLVLKIEGSLGNCPKYINKKHIEPTTPHPKLISDSAQLPQVAVDLLDRIDTLFISSSHGDQSMDTNIRGGPRGFIRVVSNENSGAVLVYPEYSGNQLYQTLGNLQTTPVAGYVFPDFETGDVLYATGRTEIIMGDDAARVLPQSRLLVRVTITAARYIEQGLGFRGIPGDPSPYNPAVRFLPSEKIKPGTQFNDKPHMRVELVKKDIITPTIDRFRFKITDVSCLPKWSPGQYATFSFRDEIDMGYSHMRDDDPQSINDDFVRTFTVSSHQGRGLPENEFEITVRKKGNATNYLFRSDDRAGIELSLFGFGGDFQIEGYDFQVANTKTSGNTSIPDKSTSLHPFIAGGIGITPLIAQIPYIDLKRLRLFWSISFEDIGLVYDTFRQFPDLPNFTYLFITSKKKGAGDGVDDDDSEKIRSLSTMGAQIKRRRLEKSDLDTVSETDAWYTCTGPSLKAALADWLAGKKVVSEDFNF